MLYFAYSFSRYGVVYISMLHCGNEWQPTLIKRVIEPLPTSTCVAKVATDTGNGFLKGMGNPAGSVSLATELVAAELAVWFGLRVPPFALVQVVDIEIPMINMGAAPIGFIQPGPGFISRELTGTTGDGSEFLLRKIINPDDIAKLVVFDTWIRNGDRCPPDPENGPYNRDNLFFGRNGSSLALTALDHSHCFVEGTLDDLLQGDDLLNDDAVYGCFPEFKPFIQAEAVASAVGTLRQIDMAVVRLIVQSVPAEWGLTAAIRDAWSTFIYRRAQRVANSISLKLVKQPCLGL